MSHVLAGREHRWLRLCTIELCSIDFISDYLMVMDPRRLEHVLYIDMYMRK